MDQETPPKLRRRVRLGLWLRNRFFAGVAIAAPIGLTVLVVWWFVTTIDRLVWSLLRQILGPEFVSTTIPGVGLIVAALALIALGALAANIAGRAVIQIGERVVARVPLVRTIYNGIKQVFETVLSGRQMTSREICLVQFPREGIWSVGFVTGDARGEPGRITGEDFVSVYIPHSPNPWTGWLIFVPRADIRPMQLASEDAAKMLLSLGLFQPDALGRDPLMKDPPKPA
ncbi:MAG: DUF502 domain-containing protein [Caulobacterales bacterium]